MNKKIYFNSNYIEFVYDKSEILQNKSIKIINLVKSSDKELTDVITDFLVDTMSYVVYFYDRNFDDVLIIFKKKFFYIEASGGLIQKSTQFLFMQRLGFWDLPKGKLEKKESIQDAAIRECEEECGIKNLQIISQLSSTFHIYKYKNSYALKQSHWFFMQTKYSKKLKPQKEENISEVKWFTKEQLTSTILNDTYLTIKDVINEAISLSIIK